jgi:hypothetical protein
MKYKNSIKIQHAPRENSENKGNFEHSRIFAILNQINSQSMILNLI